SCQLLVMVCTVGILLACGCIQSWFFILNARNPAGKASWARHNRHRSPVFCRTGKILSKSREAGARQAAEYNRKCAKLRLYGPWGKLAKAAYLPQPKLSASPAKT